MVEWHAGIVLVINSYMIGSSLFLGGKFFYGTTTLLNGTDSINSYLYIILLYILFNCSLWAVRLERVINKSLQYNTIQIHY